MYFINVFITLYRSRILKFLIGGLGTCCEINCGCCTVVVEKCEDYNGPCCKITYSEGIHYLLLLGICETIREFS